MEKIAEFYKALGDTTRLNILSMLVQQEMCVCEIIERLDMSQPAISHHLKILKQAGLVRDSREGKWIYYSLNEDVFAQVFAGEEAEVLESYAGPLRQKFINTSSSRIRTDEALCEKLTARKGK